MSKASSSAPRARWVSVENRTAATHLFGPFETHELQRGLLDDAWLGWLHHWLRRMELGQTACRLEDLDQRREAPPLVALERHPPEPRALAS